VLCAIKARSGQQVVCSKTIVAKKEKAEQVLEMCQDIEAFSQQLLRDRSSGLVEYACMKDRWEDNVIHIWERFDSNASLSNYTATDKVKAFMQQVRNDAKAALVRSALHIMLLCYNVFNVTNLSHHAQTSMLFSLYC
jgi:quinol monooxygenase YgiN